MDGQEYTTSNTAKQSRNIFQAGITLAISTVVSSACYILAPLGVLLASSKLASYVGVLIPALLSLVAIPLFPLAVAIIVFSAIDRVFNKNYYIIDRGWLFGIIIGSVILTLVWFLPLWEHSWPGLAQKLLPLRLSGLFNELWMMSLSWIAYVPMMIYANFGAVTPGNDSSTVQEARNAETSSLKNSVEGSQAHKNTADQSDKKSAEQTELSYNWQPAPETRFTDIGGMDDRKNDLRRSVLRPLIGADAAYERFNVSPPNGILLHGPPGTGKTLLAHAIAGELGHPYLELSAGDIKSRWINESTEQVNRLFIEAQQFERCVIFIDEIDALLAGRDDDLHREHAQVVNEFLAHLDAEDPNFLVIAATNRADLLDDAVTRRGRFDQQYEIGLPDHEAREAIFRVCLRDRPTTLDEEAYQELADRTKGCSSADIVGIVDDAAMSAAERDAEAITQEDLTAAVSDSNR
ncbi:AAA family ATPase [Haloarcula amylovorans]|uniref:AAA family ATPase n=1 Tax=Haloarcula amylovorans TaxID=2562280 RepID=UPI001ADDB92C|nr:AAA family ATPase [Halomicroarcula amylolytica]